MCTHGIAPVPFFADQFADQLDDHLVHHLHQPVARDLIVTTDDRLLGPPAGWPGVLPFPAIRMNDERSA